jgi:hypothetical protein
MNPQVLLIGVPVIVIASWMFRQRVRVASVTARFLLEVLDALIFGYGGYVLLCVLLEWRSFQTWEGAARIFFFMGWLSSGQKIAILLGCWIAHMRYQQGPGMGQSDPSKNYEDKREYRRGRHIMSFPEALATMNSMLAWRAWKKSLQRPQHLDPNAYYDPPEKLSVDVKSAVIPDVETNLALQPYQAKPGEYDTVLWGMLRVPEEETQKHCAVIGATGSGKTLMIHGLMTSVLPRVNERQNFRAFIYDNKPDFLPFAHELGLAKQVWNFDPFHKDGVAWDIANDVTSVAEAQQVAAALAPVDSKLTQKYFDEAAQLLLEAVMIAFIEISGKEWTFRDVLLVCSSAKRIKKLTALSKHYSVKANVAAIFGPEKSPDEVVASINVRFGPYKVAAALWSQAREKRSVREWRDKNAILLITGRSDFKQALRPINQALFRLASVLLLTQGDSKERASWFFLDEVREIGKLEGLRELANTGRSKGVRLVLGFQTIEGMRAEHEENPADEIINLCANKTFLHSNSEKTRKWMAESLGEIEVDETVFTHSHTSGPTGTSVGVSWNTQRQSRPSMRQEDLEQNIKPVSEEYGFTALNTVPLIGSYISWVPIRWSDQPTSEEKHDELREAKHQELLDWDVEDLNRLKLSADFLDEESPKRPGGENAQSREKGEMEKQRLEEKHKRLWRTGM